MSAATPNLPALSGVTPAQKRKETIARQHMAEVASLREQEANGKQKRVSKPSEKVKAQAASQGVSKSAGKRRLSEANPAIQPAKKVKGVRQKGPSVKKPPVTTYKSGAATYRRRPAEINSCSENEEASESDAASKPGRPAEDTMALSDSEQEDAASEDAHSENEDVDEDDLMNFDSEMVAKKLKSERAVFAEDPDDQDQLDVNAQELELTTASEIDLTVGANFGEEDEDEDEGEEAIAPGPKGDSKRARDRRAEAPTWKGQDEISEAESLDGGCRDVNANWTEREAHYVPAKSGARIISIRGQPEPLRNVIKAAIRMVTGDIIFKNAYVSDVGVTDYYREVSMRCAMELGYKFLFNRFETDHRFSVVVGRLLAGRVSLFRSNLKKLTNAGVQGFFQLGAGDECEKRVASLLLGTTYIFPTQPGGRSLVLRTKPFKHPAIISALHQIIASGSGRRSLIHKHLKRFTSIIPDGPRNDELEMPIPIVALVATCYHASLEEWRTGTWIGAEFNADAYEDVYLGHVETLENIRRNSPDKFHRLMADIYSSVCRGTSARTVAVSHGALSILDLDGMDE